MFAAKELPSSDMIIKASALSVLNVQGASVQFSSLFSSEKVIVVFIRHFFCGTCQQYVAQLASVRKDALESAGTQIIVIGCGDWQPIKTYSEETGFQGAIYADPTRQLYRALGMTLETLAQTPAGEQRRSYLTSGAITSALRSIWRGPIKNASLIGKQGNISQLGGDFVFGPGLQCSFAHRMQHTEDHTEMAELMEAAGVSYP